MEFLVWIGKAVEVSKFTFLILQAQQEVPVWLEEIAFGFQGEGASTSVNNQKVSLEMNWKLYLLELYLSIKVCLAVYIWSNATGIVWTVTMSLVLVVHLWSTQYFWK